jgi:ubiquinone/menaquinone biosynthesis C-methylase UbiE
MQSDRRPFDATVARDYERGRQMTPSEIRTWTTLFAADIANASDGAGIVLDLGSGTGRFSPALANELSVRVVAVEPAAEMRQVALRVNAHAHVKYVGGRAEAIPLRSDSCDAAFLFLSLHHFASLASASREISRVVRAKGSIFIRTEFSDRPHFTLWHSFLPQGAEIDRALYPPIGDVVTNLSNVGISVNAVRLVPYLAAPTLKVYIERLHLRSLSALRVLDPADIEEGLARLRHLDAELSQPVTELGHVMRCTRL